jgi:hypothetical protein
MTRRIPTIYPVNMDLHNIPPGSKHDPRAPWNKCEKEEFGLRDLLADYDYDPAYEQWLNQIDNEETK